MGTDVLRSYSYELPRPTPTRTRKQPYETVLPSRADLGGTVPHVPLRRGAQCPHHYTIRKDLAGRITMDRSS